MSTKVERVLRWIEAGRAGTHELKAWPGPFQAVRRGEKTHEVRSTKDRRFRVGDRLALLEFDPCKACEGKGSTLDGDFPCPCKCRACDGKKGAMTGEREVVRVTHVTEAGTFGLPRDVCVMSVVRVAR